MSLVIRKIQNKTTLRYSYIPTTMAKSKKTNNTKYWQGCGTHTFLMKALNAPLQKTIWQAYQKIKHIPSPRIIPFLTVYPKEIKTLCPPIFVQECSYQLYSLQPETSNSPVSINIRMDKVMLKKIIQQQKE